MDRRTFIRGAFLASLSPFLLALTPRQRRRRRRRGRKSGGGVSWDPNAPNVLLVLTDDQPVHSMWAMEKTREAFPGGDLSANGYVSVPVCDPARAGLFLGRFPRNLGITTNDGAWGEYKSRSYATRDVFQRLGARGYRLGFFGKVMNGYRNGTGWVHPSFGSGDLWYAHADGTEARPYRVNSGGNVSYEWANQTDLYGGKAEAWVRSRRNDERPWFCCLPLTAPHFPHGSPNPHTHDGAVYSSPATEEVVLSDKSAYTLGGPHEGAESQPRYEGMLEELEDVDDRMRSLLDALEETGQAENTLVFFCSDNGYLYGEHGGMTGKMRPHEGSSRTPFLVKGPGLPKDLAWDDPRGPLVSHVDVTRTILAAAGAPTWGCDGRDLRDLAAGLPWRERLYSEGPNGSWRMVREGPWAYMDFFSLGEELYDLASDPHQMESLHADPGHADLKARLKESARALSSAEQDGLRALEGAR